MLRVQVARTARRGLDINCAAAASLLHTYTTGKQT